MSCAVIPYEPRLLTADRVAVNCPGCFSDLLQIRVRSWSSVGLKRRGFVRFPDFYLTTKTAEKEQRTSRQEKQKAGSVSRPVGSLRVSSDLAPRFPDTLTTFAGGGVRFGGQHSTTTAQSMGSPCSCKARICSCFLSSSFISNNVVKWLNISKSPQASKSCMEIPRCLGTTLLGVI